MPDQTFIETRKLEVKQQDMQELQRIIERYIPLGNAQALCHVGICSINRCSRCQDALLIRQIIRRLE
jgi:hypothetical protein